MTIQNNTVDMVKRNSNEFSFVETLDSMINNHEFRDGLQDFYTGKNNKYSFVWEALSVIGQEVGNTIYENVLNYVDLASNVDLCKTKTLQSISKSIGIDFSVLNGLGNFPQEIREMIDVLSINRKYILQTDFLCQKLIDDIASKAYQDITDLKKRYIRDQFLTEINTPGYITETSYSNYLSGLYYDFMVEMVNLPYNTGLFAPIWWIEERELLENETYDDDTIKEFKKRNGIKNSFNEKAIVDKIEVSEEKLDNYYGYEKECLQMEIDRRSKTLRQDENNDKFRERYKSGYDTKLKTRYSYYRKQKVSQYINMIQSQYNGLNDIEKITGRYEIDKNFLVIPETSDFKYLIDIQKARKEKIDYSAVDLDMIGTIAKRLAQITIYISKIRDIIKVQSQKYYAKGTFNLLAFVINEYLIEFSDSDVLQDVDLIKTNVRENLSAHPFSQIDIIEYFDTTEYFNISCQTSDKSNNKKSVNTRYWEEEQDSNTNSGFAFTDSQISNFYLDEVGLNGQISDINDFLGVVFSFGANSSYSDSTSSFVITQGETDDITEANRYLYLSYSGNKYGSEPYANLKNRVHSSFQPHPYLKNFIEYTRNSYPVINAFYNDTVNEITEQEAIQKLNNYIGKYGETINVAVNNQYDYSGYKTRYEITPHDGQYDVEGYDGIFFPPAIEDFMSEPMEFIDSISSMTAHDETGKKTAYGKYYQSLGYTKKCYTYISEQLLEYKDKIFNIAQYKDSLSDVHDIYKYGTDGFGNMYMLLKKYTDYDIPFKQKKSTPGQIWIRLKNNPIAFPAFIGDRSSVETNSDFNGNIEYLSQISCIGTNITDGSRIYKHIMKYDDTDMQYFYDMEFSSDKKILMLAVYPVNDISTVGADGKYNEMISADYYKDYQHADILINQIDMWYDNVDERTKLYLQSAGNGRYKKEDSYNSTDSDKKRQLTGKSFVGFFKDGNTISPVFVEKTYDKDKNTYSLNDDNIRVSLQMWFKSHIEREYNNLTLKLRKPDGNDIRYKTNSGDVEFSNVGDIMTFAFLTEPKQNEISVQSYVGVHNGHGITNYTTQTSGYNIIEDDKGEMNSFDMLNSFVTTVDTQIVNGQLTNSSIKTYNLNSDASYIPLYPGEMGYTDISKTNYSLSPTNSFELLGESDNIDQTINIVNPNADSSKDISSLLNDFTNGVVWEDYDPQHDNSLKQFVYNQRKDGGADKGYIIWSIDISECGFTQKDLKNMSIVMYNKNTNGKNPYFIGDFTDISATSKRPFVSLKTDTGTYQYKSTDHEISSTSNPYLRVTGTYDYLSKQTNRSDNNHLNNVNDIQIYSNDNRIVVTFCPEDEQKTYFIPNDTVVIVLCNPTDLKIFKYYHYLDHRQLVKNGKIDGTYISSIEFSQYNYLSDVPGLSGHDGLDFKYSEQDVFDISSDFYYFPCFNTAYPFRGVDAFKRTRTNKSDYNVVELDGLFNQNNLFKLKIDKGNIIDEINNLEIPKTFEDNECMIGYEDFIYDSRGNIIRNDIKDIYDITDPRILQCVEMYDLNKNGTIGKINVDINPKEETREMIDRIEQSYNYGSLFLEQTSSDYIFDYETFSISSDDFDGIDKLLNIYVNYKKENDRKITLFFNYYNYINTPFIKFVNAKTTIDTREGTYLKLRSGEDGFLKIELQFKHYDYDGDIYGFTNVVVATYRIFNISDDKPKFIIHKVSGVDKDSLIRKYKVPETEIYPQNNTVYVSKEDKDRNFIEFDLNVKVYSNKILKRGTYTLTYPSNELENTDQKYKKTLNSIIIEEPREQVLHFKTRTKFDKLKTYQFSIRNVEIYDEDGQKSKITTYPGQVELIYMNYLRKESDDVGELVLTENSSDGKKIII